VDEVRVRWLAKALAGLEAELGHIAAEDADAARRIAIVVRERTESLAQFPESGRPGRVAGTRELVLAGLPFIIPYRVRGEEVQVLRFFHTSRKPPAAW